MTKRILLTALFCAATVLVCQTDKVQDPIVKVGKVTIGKESLETFTRVAGIYPDLMPYYFPAQRTPITFITECEAIYQHAVATKAATAITQKTTSGLDWQWKKRYYAASLFGDLLQENLGFTDAQLEDHYKKSPEEFRLNNKTAAGEDTSYIPPFEVVKRFVADSYFYNTYKPDSQFLAKLNVQEGNLDSVALVNYWLYNVRSNPGDFYMRAFFKEQTGTDYADSVEQLYDGDNKTIKAADIDVIRDWLPDSHKNMRIKELVEWLYKWQSFAQRAEKLGLTSKPQYKEMLHWAQRIEFAREYLKSNVVPDPEAEVTYTAQDTALAEFIAFDGFGRVDAPSVQRIAQELGNIHKIRVSTSLVDSAVFTFRKRAKVKFLQDELRDERDSNPSALMAKADSLRETASDPEVDQDAADKAMEEAENLYRTLKTSFAFTAEGRRAMGETAKLLIDRYTAGQKRDPYLLRSAINDYRRAQTLDPEPENLCNSYFMVGFTYDEHMQNFSLAEANYKWILRNAPSCALASDAEFMILHLGEPMTNIEEIQGQSMRQGRAVDFEEEVVETVGAGGDEDISDIEALLNAAM